MKRIAIATIVYALCSTSASAQPAHFPALEWLDSEGHEIATDIPGRFILDEDGDLIGVDDSFVALVEDGFVVERIPDARAAPAGRDGKSAERRAVRSKHYIPADLEAAADLPPALAKRGKVFIELRLGLLNEGGVSSAARFEICGAALSLEGSPDGSAALVAFDGGSALPTALWLTDGMPPGEVNTPLLTLELDFAGRRWALLSDGSVILDGIPLDPGARRRIEAAATGEGVFAALSDVSVYYEKPLLRKDRPSLLSPADEAALRAAFEPESILQLAEEYRLSAEKEKPAEGTSPRNVK